MRKQKGRFENVVYENASGVVTTIWNYLEATRLKVIKGIILPEDTTNLICNIFDWVIGRKWDPKLCRQIPNTWFN